MSDRHTYCNLVPKSLVALAAIVAFVLLCAAPARAQGTLASVSPTSVPSNSIVTLTLSGTGFTSSISCGSVDVDRYVYVGSCAFQNSTTLILTWNTQGVTPGTHIIYLGFFSSVNVTVTGGSTNPAPSLNSLNPSDATAGGAAFTLTVTGSNFISGSVVQWNGSSRTTTYVSATQLTAQITAPDIASAGTVAVTVFNPTPGGGTSVAGYFYVLPSSSSNPNQPLLSLYPASTAAGGVAFTLTVIGANFTSSSVVQWNGSSRTTTFVSSTELQAQILVADIANPGQVPVSVTAMASGGVSRSAWFSVFPQGGGGLPGITWVSPVATPAGSPGATLTILGMNFVSGSVVQWNGANRTATFVNSNQLTVTIPASDLTNPALGDLTVLNPGGWQNEGISSNDWTYPVTTPGVTTFAAGPQPPGIAPVAVAVDPTLNGGRIYVVHRALYRDIGIAPDSAPPSTNVLSVVNQQTGALITTIGLSNAVTNGVGQGIAVDTARHMVYVTNAGDSTVTVIDGTANATVATVTVDSGPEGIAVDSSAGIVYVAGANITLLDATNKGAVLGSIAVGAPAWALALDTTTHLVYALVGSTPASVAAVDGAHRTVKSQTSLSPLIYTYDGIAVDSGSRVYVADHNTGIITPLDITGSSPTALAGFSGGSSTIQAVAVDPVSHLVYATGGNVYVLTSAGVLQKTIPVLRFPTGIVVDPSSGNTYVTDSESDSLSVLNTAQQTMTGAISLGTETFGIAFDSSTGHLYAANSMADAVSAIDGNHNLIGSWTSGAGTWDVGVDPGLQLIYAMNAVDGTLTIFNSANGSVRSKVTLASIGGGVVKVNATTHMVYVSGGPHVWVINPTVTPPQVTTLPVSAIGIAIDEAGGRVYTVSGGTTTVLNATTNAIITTWSTPGVWKLAVDPVQKRLYGTVPCGLVGCVTGVKVFDTTSGALITEVTYSSPSNFPLLSQANAEGVAVNPVTHHVFVSDSGNGTVTVVDGSLATPALLKTFATGTCANGVAVDSANGLVYVSNVFDGTIGVFADPAGTAQNPVPAITSLNPSSATAGGVAFTLTVNGYNFVSNSSVQWNGSALTTTFINGTQLQATIPASDIASAGTAQITVFNPTPGGGTSNALPFTTTAAAAITVTTSPSGLSIIVDGITLTAPQTFNWTPGSSHSIGVASPQGTYTFSNWSDGGVQTHSITVPSTATTYTASFTASAGSGLYFYPVTPCRVADTRGNGKSGSFGAPSISGGSSRAFPIPASGCGIPATAAAYSLNVTVVPAGQLTYLTMWPTGQSMPTVSTLNDFSTQVATPGNVVANAAIVPAGTSGSVSVYVSDTSDVIIDVNGYFAPPGTGGLAFYPVTPCRVTDTRGNGKSGAFGPPSMAGGSNRSFPIPQGSCNIPSTAQAYSLNMTVVPPGQLTYLTTWPSGQGMPTVSTLNDFSTGTPAQAMGKVVANAGIVPAGTSGAVSVFVSDSSDVIIDINGYFAQPGGSGALSFYTTTPCRVADTRGNGFPTGPFGAPSMGANATRTFPVPTSSCGIPTSAQAYSLNMTVVPPGQLTYLTTWPYGQAMPTVSTLNDFSNGTVVPGRVVANAAIVPTGTNGSVNVFTSDPSDVIIDINGYFAP